MSSRRGLPLPAKQLWGCYPSSFSVSEVVEIRVARSRRLIVGVIFTAWNIPPNLGLFPYGSMACAESELAHMCSTGGLLTVAHLVEHPATT